MKTKYTSGLMENVALEVDKYGGHIISVLKHHENEKEAIPWIEVIFEYEDRTP